MLFRSQLINRADRHAAVASRIMSLAIAALSLAVAGLGLAKIHWPALDQHVESLGLTLGVAIVAAMIASFFVAMRAARVTAPAR